MKISLGGSGESLQRVGPADLPAQVEQILDHAADRSEHLPRAVNALSRLAREVPDDDLRDLPARDAAPREDLVADEVDPVADLDPPRDVASKGATSPVDVVERRSEDPSRERVEPFREDEPRPRVVALLLPPEHDVRATANRVEEPRSIRHRVLTVAVDDHHDLSRRFAQRRFR